MLAQLTACPHVLFLCPLVPLDPVPLGLSCRSCSNCPNWGRCLTRFVSNIHAAVVPSTLFLLHILFCPKLQASSGFVLALSPLTGLYRSKGRFSFATSAVLAKPTVRSSPYNRPFTTLLSQAPGDRLLKTATTAYLVFATLQLDPTHCQRNSLFQETATRAPIQPAPDSRIPHTSALLCTTAEQQASPCPCSEQEKACIDISALALLTCCSYPSRTSPRERHHMRSLH